ncbi:MAG: YggS family pyridoxal phosphate-dependent enzyme [Actinomycetota bacterium]
MRSVGESIHRVRHQIGKAAERVGRDPSTVLIVAVTKGVTSDRVVEAMSHGVFDFGENRVAEAESKADQIKGPIAWHFIGSLQSNKVGRLVRFARVIHSIDRLEIAARIDRMALVPIDVMVEVNVSGEQTKGGVSVDRTELLVELIQGFTTARVVGLMTMAPQSYDAEQARPYFRRLAGLRDDLQLRFPSIQQLSMGMSQDYEVAVEEGSTMVRVGQEIFGPPGGR